MGRWEHKSVRSICGIFHCVDAFECALQPLVAGHWLGGCGDGGRRLGGEHVEDSTPPPPLYKLRPCPSYSRCRDRINLVPNLIRYKWSAA